MNLILIERAEIICLCILSFILLYSRFYKMGKDQGYFLRICIFAIGHVLFDLITVITVNNLDTVPPVVNNICHIIFYLFALAFSYEFFCYILSICYEKRKLHRIRTIGIIILLCYMCAVPFLPLNYLHGNGTDYSFGLAAFVGYGVAMLFFILSIIVVLVNIRKLERNVIGSLLPMLSAAIIVEIIQIAVPEMLFTGGTITLITVGFFFSLENPVAVLRNKVLTDALTGVKSRHSYEADILTMNRDFASGTQFGIVFLDINGLKAVNDSMGHMTGDEYIGCVAQILMKSLKNAEAIYRMGGDEFLAVYRNKNKELIRSELDATEQACRDESSRKAYPVSVAVGFVLSDNSYSSLKKVLRDADFRMYAEKTRIKQCNAFLLDKSDDINISGLNDRVFDALSATESNRFLFVTNLSTGVTRWSVSAADYLGLRSLFLLDCNKVLLKQIHPDDRNAFSEDTAEISAGKYAGTVSEYRIRNSNGIYVSCACTGTFLRGRNGEPDLFSGTIRIRDAEESIDRLTGLRNSTEMVPAFRLLIQNHSSAAVMQLGITNLSRINMLYGYLIGDEILQQLASVIRSIIRKNGDVYYDSGKFVIILPNTDKKELNDVYGEIRHAAEQQIRLNQIAPPLKLAAGACMIDGGFLGTASFIQSNLIFAYDRSKYNEHGNLVFYDGTMDTILSGERKNCLLLIHHDAIGDREGFFMVYQPIVRSSDNRIIGAEALVRWKNESFGVVPPGNFIQWLEGDPCFLNLGNWILKQSLTEAGKILKYIPDFILNVNVAMPQFEREDFGETVLSLLSQTGFPASQLCLELTERCRELNPAFLRSQIDFFRSHKIRIALDDFGTGFSSFSLLLNLKVDEIKLDQSFVRQIQTSNSNQVLTKTLIEASKQLGSATCLEGVENEELCRYLKSYGATYYQGYYCSVPVTMDKFLDLTVDWNGKL